MTAFLEALDVDAALDALAVRLDGRDHVVDGGGADDGVRALVDVEVPGLASVVPLGVTGADEVASPPRRSLRSTGSTSSSAVPLSPRGANDRVPTTSNPPPRSDTNSAAMVSCARVKKSPSTLAITSPSYA